MKKCRNNKKNIRISIRKEIIPKIIIAKYVTD